MSEKERNSQEFQGKESTEKERNFNEPHKERNTWNTHFRSFLAPNFLAPKSEALEKQLCSVFHRVLSNLESLRPVNLQSIMRAATAIMLVALLAIAAFAPIAHASGASFASGSFSSV